MIAPTMAPVGGAGELFEVAEGVAGLDSRDFWVLVGESSEEARMEESATKTGSR
jgi:hypothetical protein